ncbi:MAG: alpha/beta hydrolase [Thermaerobacter sp.]|nr:alpha/beta hydrolase [Thermaerobacter sp.]
MSTLLRPALTTGGAASVQEFGEGPDVVLMLPGSGADRMALGLQGRSLQAAHMRALSLDYPGLGLSSDLPLPKSMEELVDYSFFALDALGVDRCHLLGHSLGSALAQEMALRSPDRIRSLVLLATWGRLDPFLALRARIVGQVVRLGYEERTALLPYFMASRPLVNAMQDGTGALGLRGSRAVTDETMRHYLELARDPDRLPRLKSLQIPALVVAGERDLMTPPEYGLEVAQALPQAEFQLLRGERASHLFHYELGEETNGHIVRFLRSLPGPGPN